MNETPPKYIVYNHEWLVLFSVSAEGTPIYVATNIPSDQDPETVYDESRTENKPDNDASN